MKHKVIAVLFMSLFWPMQASEVTGRAADLDIPLSTPSVPSITRHLESEALTKSLLQLQRLQRRRFNSSNLGILVESLDGDKVIAELNSDETFNPASVMKMATSFFALSRLGPDHCFQTAVYGDNEINVAKKSLKGNLYLTSDGDPVFQTSEGTALVRSLVRRGLRRVDGDLVVAGPFKLNMTPTTQKSAEGMRRLLGRLGVRLTGRVRCFSLDSVDVGSKVQYLSHSSAKLRDILWLQNAHSINEIADRLGDSLGGPEKLRQFLIEAAQLEPSEIYVARPSGLEHNRMTPRAGVKILRALNQWLTSREMKMQDIMPVAGMDEGTLFGRLRDANCLGGILGKTGTNPSKDGGISSLAGIAYTRDHGPLLYAVFNTHGSIRLFRRWQDCFLRNLMEESGGVGQYLSPRVDMASLYAGSGWLPSSYWGSLTEDPIVYRKSAVKSSAIHKVKYFKKASRHHRRASARRTGA